MAAPQDKRTDWASPKQFHHYAQRYAYKHAAKLRAEMQREEASEWTVSPKEEPSSGNRIPAKHTKKEEARSVLPRDSVIQQYTTTLASIATRSTAAQTSTASKSTATQTSNPAADGRALQQWRSTQGSTGWSSRGRSTASSRPLSNLGIRVGGRQLAPRPPRQSSCGAAPAPPPKICMLSTGAAALTCAPVALRRRRAGQQCVCGPRRRGCHRPRRTEGAELSGGGGGLGSGPAVTQLRSHLRPTLSMQGGRERARYYKESPSCYLTHIQSDTSLHLHVTIVRTHSRCSHDMWYHERASVHFTTASSLRLKSGVSHDPRLCWLR